MVSYHRGAQRNGVVASAFVVRSIDMPEDARVERPNRWFVAGEGKWTTSRLPTRGEYLVHKPNLCDSGKRVQLLLQLRAPFIVWVR